MPDNNTQKNYKDSKVLRTYTSDMADAIRTDEMSVIKIALAEKEKREQEAVYREAEGTSTSKILLIVGGVVLIVAAIIGSYFLIQKKKEKEVPIPIPGNQETFITYNANSYIDVTDKYNVMELLDAIKQQENQNTGLIKALFLTKKINNVDEQLTSNSFLSIIKTSIPGALTRSLSDKFLFGRYSNKNSVNPVDKSATFLVFQTNDYTQAYASMLDWEETMLKDLSILFNINIPESDNIVFQKPWKDIIVNNKDARVLYNESGEALLYYVFMNKNNFIITNSLEALKEIISRLTIKNPSL
jgi:hypothetical protein